LKFAFECATERPCLCQSEERTETGQTVARAWVWDLQTGTSLARQCGRSDRLRRGDVRMMVEGQHLKQWPCQSSTKKSWHAVNKQESAIGYRWLLMPWSLSELPCRLAVVPARRAARSLNRSSTNRCVVADILKRVSRVTCHRCATQ